METVVALTIVGITAVGALGAVAANLRAAERSRRALEAEALATHRLAVVELLTEQELVALPDSIAEGRFEAPLAEYRWTTASSNREEEPGVHEVEVRIEWTSGAYTLRSAIYRRPLVTGVNRR